MTTSPEQAVSQALEYARHRWPVFPCQPGSKQPATRHGFKNATTDPAQIRQWWQRQPAANLAIATGTPGPDVLDIDQHGPAGNGYAAFSRLYRAGLLDGASTLVATPSGGLHAYFTGTTQPSGRLPCHHIDFKATGGYVLAPPSVVGGKPYRRIAYLDHPGPLDWTAVTSLLEPQPRHLAHGGPVTGDLSHLTAWVERQTEGNRNSGLFWAACRALEANDLALLDDLAAAAARTGLGSREITRTISSARRACTNQAGREAAQ